jgi:hypothetical protein
MKKYIFRLSAMVVGVVLLLAMSYEDLKAAGIPELGNSIKPSPQENSAKTNYKFTEEDIQRFERLQLDVQSALDAGSSLEDISIVAKRIEVEENFARQQSTQAYEDLKATDIPESCICSEETIMEAPVGVKHPSMGIMHHCRCGKLDCVTHKIKRDDNHLFCQEVGIFKSGGGNISPCQCSKALVKKDSAGEPSPYAGIMHHCKCGKITCAIHFVSSLNNNPSAQLACN